MLFEKFEGTLSCPKLIKAMFKGVGKLICSSVNSLQMTTDTRANKAHIFIN